MQKLVSKHSIYYVYFVCFILICVCASDLSNSRIILLPFFLLLAILFAQGDKLQVKVNKLSSTKTQLPYDYYFLDYCKPSNIMNNAENLGEVLRGDRIENSVYTVSISFLSVWVNKFLSLDIPA